MTRIIDHSHAPVRDFSNFKPQHFLWQRAGKVARMP